jgi:hypothetical protein
MVQPTQLAALIEKLEQKDFHNSDLIQFELDTERIANLCKALQHHATAYTLVRPQAKGNALDETMEKIQEYAQKLVDVVLSVPGVIGTSLRNEFVDRTKTLVITLQDLITSDTELKPKVGKVWEACADLEQIPRTNCAFVSSRLLDIVSMLQDAESDVQEMLDGIGFDGEALELSESDKQFVTECKSLIKTSLLSAKRLSHLLKNTKLVDPFWIQLAESGLRWAYLLSEKADDIACTLEFPLDKACEELQGYIAELGEACKHVVELLKKGETNTKWLDLCEQQLEMLLSKLQIE